MGSTGCHVERSCRRTETKSMHDLVLTVPVHKRPDRPKHQNPENDECVVRVLREGATLLPRLDDGSVHFDSPSGPVDRSSVAVPSKGKSEASAAVATPPRHGRRGGQRAACRLSLEHGGDETLLFCGHFFWWSSQSRSNGGRRDRSIGGARVGCRLGCDSRARCGKVREYYGCSLCVQLNTWSTSRQLTQAVDWFVLTKQ